MVLSLLLLQYIVFADGLPLLGLAHAGVRVSDIAKAQAFYTGVLGYEMPFDLKMPDGQALMLRYYKVNDNQFLEIYPNLKPDATYRMQHVAFITDDIEKLHKMFEERGLKPGPINPGRDGVIEQFRRQNLWKEVPCPDKPSFFSCIHLYL